MKYALVTGATKGIGLKITQDLLDKGFFVIANYGNSDQDAEIAKKKLFEISNNFEIIKKDLSKPEELKNFVCDIKKTIPNLDYLILNAGTTDYSDFGEISLENWNRVLNVNLTTPFFLTQELKDFIRKDGKIIFIGSLLGIYPQARSVSYGVSKSAVHMLSKSLVKFFKDKKITVNSIAPGFVETAWQKSKTKCLKEKIKNKIALGRFAEVDEISKAVSFLIENSYVNGQVLSIDGGYLCE